MKENRILNANEVAREKSRDQADEATKQEAPAK